MVVPFYGERFKILDFQVQRYIRCYDDERKANRYARRRNGPRPRTYRLCGWCQCGPCECGSRNRRANRKED